MLNTGLRAFRTFFAGAAINAIAPPISRIYLRLRFVDPDGVVRDFPTNYPVTVRFGTGAGSKTVNRTVQAGGLVTVDARTANPWQSFTLEFPATDIPYIICEALGSPPASPPLFHLAAGLAGVVNHGQRYFSLPKQWSMGQADWSPPVFVGNGRYDSPPGVIAHTLSPPADISIGTPASPVVLTLIPHWHFARWEFYDRYFGNAHLDSPPRAAHRKRISTPALPVEAFRNNPNVGGAAAPDTVSRWEIDLGSQSLLQAFPFVLRRDAGGVALSPPDGAHLGLRFHTAANTVVYSRTDQLRVLAVSPPPAVPGPDRLRYYDIPTIWKSTKYYVRRTVSSPPAPGKFINTATVAEIAQAESKDSPLVFSLDDLVLRVGNPAGAGSVGGATASPPTRVALFNHRFDGQLPDSSFHGVYKMLSPPPSPPTDVPASDVTVTNHYVYDYPDWTRLAIAQGNLFDVFDRRTPDVAGQVVGARAAVRWVDNKIGRAHV